MSYAETLFTAWLPEVLPYCMDALEIVAINAVRNSAIEFLEKTHWLQTTVPAVVGTAGQSSYAVSIPADTDLVRLQAAFYDNIPLIPRSEDQLRAMYVTDWRTVTGLPRFFLGDPDNQGSILLCPAPSITEAAALSVVAVLKPTRAATAVATRVYEMWCEPIAAGAIARLARTPGMSYTNQRLAGQYEALFRSGVGDARIDRNRSQERTQLAIRPPPFV
jgi:hypothetical protein